MRYLNTNHNFLFNSRFVFAEAAAKPSSTPEGEPVAPSAVPENETGPDRDVAAKKAVEARKINPDEVKITAGKPEIRPELNEKQKADMEMVKRDMQRDPAELFDLTQLEADVSVTIDQDAGVKMVYFKGEYRPCFRVFAMEENPMDSMAQGRYIYAVYYPENEGGGKYVTIDATEGNYVAQYNAVKNNFDTYSEEEPGTAVAGTEPQPE